MSDFKTVDAPHAPRPPRQAGLMLSPVRGRIHELALRPCGARCRRHAGLCKAPAMANGRCRMHGGKSTGPVSVGGKQRARRAVWKHGFFSEAMREERQILRDIVRECREVMKEMRRR